MDVHKPFAFKIYSMISRAAPSPPRRSVWAHATSFTSDTALATATGKPTRNKAGRVHQVISHITNLGGFDTKFGHQFIQRRAFVHLSVQQEVNLQFLRTPAHGSGGPPGDQGQAQSCPVGQGKALSVLDIEHLDLALGARINDFAASQHAIYIKCDDLNPRCALFIR
jgi:hypothetical protein